MTYSIVVPDAKKTNGKRLISVFPDRVSAELWLAGVSLVQSGTVWQVWASNMGETWPIKVLRWVFYSQEEARIFIRQMRIEETFQLGKWRN